MDHRRLAGLLLFAGGIQFLIGLLIAEALYPDYSIANNFISDLGVGPQPSWAIFNVSVFLFGLMGFLAAWYMWQAKMDRVLPIVLMVSGIGAMGVGLVHEDVKPFHLLFALLAFGGGGLVALFSYRMVGWPTGYVPAVLGLVSLTALVLFALDIYLGLGPGGMERMVLYPTLLWIMGLGWVLVVPRIGLTKESSGPAR